MKNVALVLAGLLAGVVSGAFLAPLVPVARAEEQRPAVARWEQFCEPAGSISEGSSMAGARGAEGWELVGFFGGALCFKRPAGGSAKPAPPRPSDSAWPGY
jgi:hypothetical protein